MDIKPHRGVSPVDSQAFGRLLHAARIQKGMTLNALSKAAGVSLNTIWRIEAGKRFPSFSLAVRLAAVLQVDVNSLIPGGLREAKKNAASP